ncbi:unnamed protein product [Peniophora sp. CBMAI 1063]|nr:unnamed protein product [Peniophora sp. CBMAI 1063]
MVRRRSTKPKGKSAPRPVDRKDSKMKRWETADDIPMDDEDQFHASKDQILLDGADLGDDDDEGDVDEVFALKGMPSDSDDDEEGGDEEDVDMDEDEPAPAPKKEKKKAKGKAVVPPDSDEEKAGESEEEESWGAKKSAYYSSNAQEMDSDDEEANELEEQEARRLQSKARETLDDDDFGLGDVVEVVVEEDAEDLLEEPEPVAADLSQDKLSLLRHLAKDSPETLALANDWEDTAARVVRAQEKLQKLEAEQPNAMSLGMVHLHYQTLVTYATNLAFYLHLCASPKYASHPSDLRKHPVFTRLLQLKEALSTLEELDFDASEGEEDEEDDEDLDSDFEGLDDEELEDLDDDEYLEYAKQMLSRKKGSSGSKVELDDLEALLRDAERDLPTSDSELSADDAPPPPPKKQKKRKESGAEEPAKKKRKTTATSAAPVFDLEEPEFVPSSKKRASTSAAADPTDVYGDALTLTSTDAADKQARRKTLRFHASKIESAAARRAGARQALGGDDDIPYKERRREAEKRKEREARERGAVGGDDLDDEEPASAPSRSRGDGDEGEDDEGDDGYYSLIKKQKKEKKEAKKAEHDAAVAAAREALMEDTDSADGPRGLTRAILKNRGLTPHRSKSVRNPRVKKRQRYDQAKKKLASQRAVYKEGPRDVTRYEGEKSGISKVVKSVKFN